MSVDDRIAGLLRVAGIQVHVDGRESAFGPVWEAVSACLEPDFVIQATGSTALDGNQTHPFLPRNLASSLVYIQNLGRGLASAPAGEQGCQKAGFASSGPVCNKTGPALEGERMPFPPGCSLLAPRYSASLNHFTLPKATPAARGSGRRSDSRSEMRAASCVQF